MDKQNNKKKKKHQSTLEQTSNNFTFKYGTPIGFLISVFRVNQVHVIVLLLGDKKKKKYKTVHDGIKNSNLINFTRKRSY